ncbi:hypothetical protein [Natrinema altunense]|uniref:Cyclic nucleotide-binding domain-containing protein n=1 Tax=Natrinema altunense TaxID=222984 RepID=A0A482XVW4_9EURY|nr:hypothetical protein [Natrinema altunense]RZH67132.1 hypothetical protein ELS17_15345 [Natrinema altunense]
MPVLQSSRRGVLRTGLVAVGIGTAGCADESPGESDSDSRTERVSSPDTASIRGDTATPLVRRKPESDDAGGGDEGGDSDADAGTEAASDLLLVLTGSTAVDELEYDRDREESDAVRSLLAGTSFGEESVIVYQDRVGECYAHRLEYVEGNTRRVTLQFCRVKRDASIACDLDREQLQATFVRVPFAYEAEPTDRSVGVSSTCETSPGTDGDSDGSEDGLTNVEGAE